MAHLFLDFYSGTVSYYHLLSALARQQCENVLAMAWCTSTLLFAIYFRLAFDFFAGGGRGVLVRISFGAPAVAFGC